MKLRDLITELLGEDMDSEVYGKYTNEDGTDVFFSMDGLSLSPYKNKYNVEVPTIVLDCA